MQARHVMTSDVIAVSPDTAVSDIAKKLLSNRISAVPVVDGEGRVVGIVSEGDLMRRTETKTERHSSWWLALFALPEDRASRYIKGHGRHAKDVMTRDVVTVSEDASLAEIVETLEEHRIKRVPVVRDGRLVGIVSRANLLHGFASIREEAIATSSPDDQSLRERVVGALRQDLGVTEAYVNVLVADGVVDLWGTVDGAEQKRAMIVAVENISGVREIRDHVYVIPPSILAVFWGE